MAHMRKDSDTLLRDVLSFGGVFVLLLGGMALIVGGAYLGAHLLGWIANIR